MDVESAYNVWAKHYDTDVNKTRDLEGAALRDVFRGMKFEKCLEVGCGTGKNTGWLAAIASEVTSVDLSNEMLGIARQKVTASNVKFTQADINQSWNFATSDYDLIIFSLVLEHIEDIDGAFEKISRVTRKGGKVYIGELHPFRQYGGAKARFSTIHGEENPKCFTHHVSDYTTAASKYGFRVDSVQEYFDEGNRNTIPRLLILVLEKQA